MATAFTLEKKGVKTLLVDKKARDKIGDKVCGDSLSPIFTEKAHELIGPPMSRSDTEELQNPMTIRKGCT